jgi:hypothetical protein
MDNCAEKIILDGSGKQKLRMILSKQEIEPYVADFLRLILQIICLFIILNLVFIFVGILMNQLLFWLTLGFIVSIVICPVASIYILKNKEKKLL